MFENNNFENNNNNQNESINFDESNIAKIIVIGVGGGGNNTVHSMIKEGVKGIKYVVANTDDQVLNGSPAEVKIHLGKTTNGLGAGANPEVGRKAALESEQEIKDVLDGADMVIIASGMGGGTGTGAAPVVAKVAKDLGALTIAVITTPFVFEGTKRVENASDGLENLRQHVDSFIVVSNDKLLEHFGDIPFHDSFLYADKVLKQSIRTITDLIAVKAYINLDFADVSTVMKNKGAALIGIGKASGEDRAIKAATHAISSPILEASISGATHAIINVSGKNVTLLEANKVVETIKQASKSDLITIFGISADDNDGDFLQVSVIATGLKNKEKLSFEEIKEEVATVVENLDVDFENEKTREILISNPLREEDKMTITDEIELQSPSNNDFDDEDDELPEFLRN